MHYLRILCGIGHFLWRSTLLKTISAFFTAASIRLITVETFQAIPLYVSNEGLPRIYPKGLLMKRSILLPIASYMFVYQRKNLVLQQESFRALFHAQLLKFSLIIWASQKSKQKSIQYSRSWFWLKMHSPGVDGFTNDQQTSHCHSPGWSHPSFLGLFLPSMGELRILCFSTRYHLGGIIEMPVWYTLLKVTKRDTCKGTACG